MCVPCRGTPFQICRSTMQPTIRAGRSHLPCGTSRRALTRKHEAMGENDLFILWIAWSALETDTLTVSG